MICQLCGEDKQLQNSHIIPEFLYKPLYDDKHRFCVLSTDKERKTSYEQKGVREKLLCRDCEQLLSRFEDYVRRVFYGGVTIEISERGNEVIIENINYKKFKLFQLSLLWRASISNSVFFSKVNLGPHENILTDVNI